MKFQTFGIVRCAMVKLHDESATDLSFSVSNCSNLSTRNSANQIRKMMIYVNPCLLVLCNNETKLQLFLSTSLSSHFQIIAIISAHCRWMNVCSCKPSVRVFNPFENTKIKYLKYFLPCFVRLRLRDFLASFYCVALARYGLATFCSTFSLCSVIHIVTSSRVTTSIIAA